MIPMGCLHNWSDQAMSPQGITLCFCFGHMTMPIGLISVDLLTRVVFFEMPWISKSFELPNFLALHSHGWIVHVVETKAIFFLEKCIITLLLTKHIKLNVNVHAKSRRFPHFHSSPLLSHSLFVVPHLLLLRNG
jgi:hypothetical protein